MTFERLFATRFFLCSTLGIILCFGEGWAHRSSFPDSSGVSVIKHAYTSQESQSKIKSAQKVIHKWFPSFGYDPIHLMSCEYPYIFIRGRKGSICLKCTTCTCHRQERHEPSFTDDLHQPSGGGRERMLTSSKFLHHEKKTSRYQHHLREFSRHWLATIYVLVLYNVAFGMFQYWNTMAIVVRRKRVKYKVHGGYVPITIHTTQSLRRNLANMTNPSPH